MYNRFQKAFVVAVLIALLGTLLRSRIALRMAYGLGFVLLGWVVVQFVRLWGKETQIIDPLENEIGDKQLADRVIEKRLTHEPEDADTTGGPGDGELNDG